MNHPLLKYCPIILATLCGCASVQYGDKNAELSLKQLKPIPDKVSLYVCRENAAFFGAGARTTVYVGKTAIGTLKPNNFAHVVLPPGKHEIYLDRGALSGHSGVLTVDAKAGEVEYVWAGMTGGGWGTLTVDRFDSTSDAAKCVRDAEYAVKPE